MASVNSRDSFSTMSLGTVSSTIKFPSGAKVTNVEMMQRLKKILPRENLKHNMTVYKNCFKANDAITAFRTAFPAEIVSNEAAIAFGRSLQRARLMAHVCDPRKAFRDGHFFFRLQCFQQPEILNSYRIYDEAFEGSGMDMLDLIAAILTKVEQDAFDVNSRLVDYRVAHKSQFFYFLDDVVCKLQTLDLGSLDEITRCAAVVNIYNMMMRYSFMKIGVPDSRSARSQFFSEAKINIGGDILSFNDLYHGILRGNRPPQGASSGVFGGQDPRCRLSLSKMDPRIHFALNQSPTDTSAVNIYPSTLHYDLDREAKKFLGKHTSVMIDSANRTLYLTPIFKWYKADFNGSDWLSMLQFIERNVEGGKKIGMQGLLGGRRSPKIEYADFDWGLSVGNFFPFKLAAIKANEKRLL